MPPTSTSFEALVQACCGAAGATRSPARDSHQRRGRRASSRPRGRGAVGRGCVIGNHRHAAAGVTSRSVPVAFAPPQRAARASDPATLPSVTAAGGFVSASMLMPLDILKTTMQVPALPRLPGLVRRRGVRSTFAPAAPASVVCLVNAGWREGRGPRHREAHREKRRRICDVSRLQSAPAAPQPAAGCVARCRTPRPPCEPAP